jgi:hypothetical protein
MPIIFIVEDIQPCFVFALLANFVMWVADDRERQLPGFFCFEG